MDRNTWILAVLGVISLIEASSGLRCYQCRQTSALPGNALYDSVVNDVDTDLCPDWDYTTPRDHDVYCNPAQYDTCVKMVLYDNHSQQNYFIYRDCYKSNSTCSELADTSLTHSSFGQLTGRIYCCSGEHCNGSNGLKMDKVVGVVLALMASVWVLLQR